MPRVLVVGSANVDFTVTVARLPGPGETVSGGTLLVSHGGKGANQALAARRLGAEVRFVGCVGEDAAGRQLRQSLADEGLDVSGLVTTGGAATGTALIVVDPAGRNQIAVAPGANRALEVGQVAARCQDLAWAQVVLCQLETPLAVVRHVLASARRHGAWTILNPAPVDPAAVELLELADYLTPNAGEAERLTGVTVRDRVSAGAAAAALRERGAATVIVTLGEDGALALDARGAVHAPALPVRAVDTTGAGDAFSGALAVALAEGRELADALAFASAAAGLACTRRGAQPSLPARAEVDRRLGR